MIRYKNIALALIALLTTVLVRAQDVSAIEFTRVKSLWFNSNNSAGLSIMPLNNFNEVSINYSFNNGNFKMQQQGDKGSNLSFNTNGAYKMGSYALWGDFTFDNETSKNSRFNTMMFNPLRDMPYIVTDPIVSDWKKQSYHLSFKVASPIFGDLVAFGIQTDYFANTGAKQNDPRSTNYNYSINIKPGFMFNISNRHNIGLNFIYENSFERVIPENSNNQQSQAIYIMKGLGNFSQGIVGGIGGIKTFYYKSNLIGGALQYGLNGKLSMLVEGMCHYKVEDSFQDPTKPERMGTLKQQYIESKIQLMLDGNYTHKLTLEYSDKNSDGIEYIQVIDKSVTVQNWITLAKYIRSNYRLKQANFQYDIFKTRDKGYSWGAGLVGEYSDRFDQYYLPTSTLKAENIYYGFFVKKNFAFCKKRFLLIGLNLGYNSNIRGNYIYGGAEPNSLVVQELFTKDIAYLTENYLKTKVDINFTTLVYKKMALFVKLNTIYLKPPKGYFNNKIFANFSMGLTF